jgi:hypothetical protein
LPHPLARAPEGRTEIQLLGSGKSRTPSRSKQRQRPGKREIRRAPTPSKRDASTTLGLFLHEARATNVARSRHFQNLLSCGRKRTPELHKAVVTDPVQFFAAAISSFAAVRESRGRMQLVVTSVVNECARDSTVAIRTAREQCPEWREMPRVAPGLLLARMGQLCRQA